MKKALFLFFLALCLSCEFVYDFTGVDLSGSKNNEPGGDNAGSDNTGSDTKHEFEALNAPQNIRIEENVLRWSEETRATGYIVSLFDAGGNSLVEELVTITEYDLSIFNTSVAAVRLKSIGNGKDLLDSPFSYSLSYTTTFPFDREEIIFDDAPAPLLPIPVDKQVAWHQLEQYAFIHYGPNTYQNMEWGFGRPGEGDAFRPENNGGSSASVYTKQWIDEMKALGMNGLIFTAKHHDGFCLFQTKTTLHSLRNTSYSGGGNDDIVRDLARLCHENDMRLGLYLSPGDRNSWAYREDDYKYIFREQVNELIQISKSQQGSNPVGLFEIWFDGANQVEGWYGGDTYEWHKANGAGALPVDENGDWIGDTNFDYYPSTHNPTSLPSRGNADENSAYLNQMKEETSAQIYAQNDSVVIFGRDIQWVGNEQGWAGRTNFSLGWNGLATGGGQETGTFWFPSEVDVKTENGWFNSTAATTPRTYLEMIEFWYRSVGRNATLLLNFSPGRNGLIGDRTLTEARKYWATIQKHFEKNLVADDTIVDRIEASNIRGGSAKYSPQNLADEDFESYWATDDDVYENAHITYVFRENTTFNRVMLQEFIRLGQRVKEFKVEYSMTDGADDWALVTYPNMPTSIHGDSDNPDVTTTIGYKRILRTNNTTAKRVRITFISTRNITEGVPSNAPFAISKIGIYNAVDPVF